MSDRVSITFTGTRPATASAPARADWYVADTPDEIVRQSTPVAPPSAAPVKAAAKAPGAGAAVSGQGR